MDLVERDDALSSLREAVEQARLRHGRSVPAWRGRHRQVVAAEGRALGRVAAGVDACALGRVRGLVLAAPAGAALRNREREGHNLRWLSRLHWFLGQNAAAEQFAEQAIEILQALPTGRELAWALSNRAQRHMLARQTAAAVTTGLRAIALGLGLGDVEIQVHALNNVGAAQYEAGMAEGHARFEESPRLSLAHGFSEHVARACVNLVSSALIHREYGPARHFASEAARVLRDA